MEKFSAGYVNINPNFVIQNLETRNKNCEPVFAVLNNILLRGCPTIPSKLLVEKFGEIQGQGDEFKYSLNFQNCDWVNIIKGGADRNPALKFYEETLAALFGGASATFIPEVPLVDIVHALDSNGNISQTVDFYSPLYKTVVEIDGMQHRTSTQQVIRDEERNAILHDNGVKLIRIPTNYMHDLEFIRALFNEVVVNSSYQNSLISKNMVREQEIKYMVATRIELFLLNLYMHNYLYFHDSKVQLNICSAENIEKNIFETAVESFYLWLDNICKLQNIDFIKPEIEITMIGNEQDLALNQNGFNLYISLFDVYSQAKYENVFYIKNDFFLYESDLVSYKESGNYPFKKNYYDIKIAEISYGLSREQHYEALQFVLTNISNVYTDFRANQFDIILECLNNRGVIGVLPTGAGKSLCYQLCSLLIPSRTLLIAPLQLLMADQKNSLVHKLGITNAVCINSDGANRRNIEVFKAGRSLITIVSPERFFNEQFIDLLYSKKVKVGFVVVDEAHCLSEWGHDFRTSYLCLSHNLGRLLPSSTFLMALTGTASHRVFEDIDCEFRNFKQKVTRAIFADSMRRDNLSIIIQSTETKYKEMFENILPTLMEVNKDKTLIFTKKVSLALGETSEASACWPLSLKVVSDAVPYNKNMSEMLVSCYASEQKMAEVNGYFDKMQELENFRNDKTLIMFATKAFGMGVDIPNIRKTIHYGLPSSFEGLYQEIGRAGRDGNPSKCYIYYTKENPEVLKEFFRVPSPTIAEIENNLEYLRELNTNFWFVQSSNLDIDAEVDAINSVLNYIKNKFDQRVGYIDCNDFRIELTKLNNLRLSRILNNAGSRKTIIEKALYRLYLLGEIDMWGVVYGYNIDNPYFTNLKLTSLSEEEKFQRLRSHIEKYETNFSFEKENTFLNRVKFLSEWTYKNYLQERIQTMKNLYEQCEAYTNSELFMTYLSNYFANDPVYNRLTDRNVGVNDWIEAIKAHPEKTKARIARLLESYDKVVALNYVSGITRLRLGEFDNSDGEARLRLALEYVAKFSDEDRLKLIKDTCKYLDDSQRDIFIECWLQYSKNDVFVIYELTHSLVCENFLIVDFANELIKLGGDIDDRL